MLHGSVDMSGAVLHFVRNQDRAGMEWIIRIVPATAYTALECGVESEELVTNIFFFYINLL